MSLTRTEFVELYVIRHLYNQADRTASELTSSLVRLAQEAYNEIHKSDHASAPSGWVSFAERAPTEDDGDSRGLVLVRFCPRHHSNRLDPEHMFLYCKEENEITCPDCRWMGLSG